MGKSRRILFVCEGNIHRSRTAEALYAETPGLAVRSAGLSPLARTQVTEELLAWAEEVFVMEKRLRRMLRRRFPEALPEKTIICLDIPDDYQHMDAALIALLIERLTPYLGVPNQTGSGDFPGICP